LTSRLDLQAYASYVYVSSRPNNLGSTPGVLANLPDIPSSQIFNLSAGVEHDSGVTVSMFANNLFDERKPSTRFRVAGVWDSIEMNRPRTVGLRVGYRF